MKRIRTNFLFSFGYQILLMAVPLVTMPYISRTLGASGIGTYSYAYSIAYYFVLVMMLGLNNYGNRTIAQTRDDIHEMSKAFVNIYTMQLGTGVIGCTLYVLYCLFLSKNITITALLGLYVLSAIFDVNWFFDGLEQFKMTVTRNSLVKVCSAIAIFLFVRSKNDTAVYCLIMALSFLVSQVVLWPYVLKHVIFEKPQWTEVKKHIKPNLVLFVSVIAISLYKVLDKLMLGTISNVSQVGYFESSEKIINIPIAVISALGAVMLPYMSNQVMKVKKFNDRVLDVSLIIAMITSSALCFGIMSVSKQFVPFFYGSGFEECIPLFLILLPSCLFLAFANVVRTQYLLPYRLDKIYVQSAFFGAAVNVIINLLLIPKYHAVGTAIGTLFAEATVCIYQCYAVRKSLPFRKYLIQIIPAISSGLVMFVVNFFVDVGPTMGIMAILIKILIGATIFIVLMLLQLHLFKRNYVGLLNKAN